MEALDPNGLMATYCIAASVVSQEQLYSVRHSGLDPESRFPGLDFRFRGNDNMVMGAGKASIGTPRLEGGDVARDRQKTPPGSCQFHPRRCCSLLVRFFGSSEVLGASRSGGVCVRLCPFPDGGHRLDRGLADCRDCDCGRPSPCLGRWSSS